MWFSASEHDVNHVPWQGLNPNWTHMRDLGRTRSMELYNNIIEMRECLLEECCFSLKSRFEESLLKLMLFFLYFVTCLFPHSTWGVLIILVIFCLLLEHHEVDILCFFLFFLYQILQRFHIQPVFKESGCFSCSFRLLWNLSVEPWCSQFAVL